MTGSVSTVEPAYAATPAERTLVLHLFDNLYRWTAEGRGARSGYHRLHGQRGRHADVQFHLRRDGKWSEQQRRDGGGFVYAWRRLVSPETDSPEAEILSMVAGYEDAHAGDPEALGVYAEDEHTFVVTLSTMCPYFVDAVSQRRPPCRCSRRLWKAARAGAPAGRGSWQQAVPPHRRLERQSLRHAGEAGGPL